MFQRPDDFLFDPTATLAEGLVFAGLGGGGCVGSADYFDSSLYGNCGKLTNMDPISDWQWSGELGRWVLNFDGSNDYVTNVLNRTLLEPWSIAAWIYCASNGLHRHGVFGASPGYYGLSVVHGTEVRVFTYWGFNGRNSTWTDDTDFLGRWRHLVVTVDANKNGMLYIDGVAQTGQRLGEFRNCAYLGRVNPSHTGFVYLLGYLADPLIYNRDLTTSEIQALADPSNVMLSGLILPPRRILFPVVSSYVDPNIGRKFALPMFLR